MHRLHRPAALLATSALALTLAACGGGDKPTPTEATTPATTSPAATSANRSTGPKFRKPSRTDYPGMTINRPEKANLALKYFLTSLIYGYQSGETTALEDASSQNCSYCKDAVAAIRNHRAGQTGWGPATLNVFDTSALDKESLIDFRVTVGPHGERTADGKPGIQVPKTSYHGTTRLTFSSGRWIVDEFTIVKDLN